MIRVLIIGCGSIGLKHAHILSDMGCNITFVSKRIVEKYCIYPSIEAAISNHQFDFVIVSNNTHLHYSTLQKIISLGFNGKLLIEKPLFSKREFFAQEIQRRIYVAYNLRFHAFFDELKKLIMHDEIISCAVMVGSYLPDWRASRDYRETYSAKKNEGGGVLRDLSHELDYVLWLFGQCYEVVAMGGHFSSLEIDSDDAYSILMRCERCQLITIQLDYLNKTPTRKVVLNTKNQHTIIMDFMSGDLFFDNQIVFHVDDGIQKTYRIQNDAFMNDSFEKFCTINEGLNVLHLIESIEQSVLQKKWISL